MGRKYQLIACANRLGNGAVFKRLGFLAERARARRRPHCSVQSRLTKGYPKFDPGLKCTRVSDAVETARAGELD